MKRFLLAALLLMVPALAEANTCVCSASTCTSTAAGNWSGCNATPPGATDDVVIQSGKTVTLDSSPTWNTLEVQSGGTFKCTDDSTARTLTIDNTKTDAVQSTLSDFIKVDAGGVWDCDGATGVEGVNLTVAYTGTIPGATGASFLVGHGTASNYSTTTDATFKMRGLKRTSSSISNLGAGATNDFVWCADVAAGIGTIAVGDTVVFTSGRFRGYWGRVDARPASDGATAECDATACASGTCDIQVDMNDADRAFLSMTKVANLGGPSHDPTPDDANGDGTADNTIMFPQNGDSIEVFKPFLFQGGANAITGGFRFLVVGAQMNMRYGEFESMTASRSNDSCTINTACIGAGNPSACCTGAGTGTCNTDGTSSIHLEMINATSTEGDIAFMNFHDWASEVLFEWNGTDRIGDSRSNYPIAYRWFYIHDVDANVAGTCNDNNQRIGGAVAITTDNGSVYNISGLTAEHIHIARTNAPGISSSGPQSTSTFQWDNIVINDAIIHDIPWNTTYAYNVAAATASLNNFGHGTGVRLNGWSIWDIGAASDTMAPLGMRPNATNITAVTKTDIQAREFFIANWDANTDAAGGTTSGVDMRQPLSGSSVNTDTANVRLSNSYIASGVGACVYAGASFYNFCINSGIDNDGSAPCAGTRRGAFVFPEDAYGNVVIQTKTTACSPTGFYFPQDDYGQPTPFATRTRKIVSNVVMPPNVGAVATQGAYMRGGTETIDTDFYNNLFDQGNVNSANGYCLQVVNSSGSQKVTARFNICMSPKGNGVGCSGFTASGTLAFAYNRYYRNPGNLYDADPDGAGTCAAATGCPTEVDDDDNDFFLDSSVFNYTPACNDSIRDDNPWGAPIGPIAYGIRDFSYFHPAALAAMNSNVFKIRYNWTMCSDTAQDSVPR